MEEVSSSETVVPIYKSTQRYIPEDWAPHQHCCEKVKYLILKKKSFQNPTERREPYPADIFNTGLTCESGFASWGCLYTCSLSIITNSMQSPIILLVRYKVPVLQYREIDYRQISGDKTTHFNFGIKWKRVANFTIRPLQPHGKTALYSMDKNKGGSHTFRVSI
jgi:hypothetical protein